MPRLLWLGFLSALAVSCIAYADDLSPFDQAIQLDDVSAWKPAGSGQLVRASSRVIDDPARPQNKLMQFDFEFKSSAELSGWVYYDVTQLLGDILKAWSPEKTLQISAAIPVDSQLVVQIQSASGRWYQGHFDIVEGEALALSLTRRQFNQTWIPGKEESYGGPIDGSIVAMRVGVRGHGKGAAVIDEITLDTLYREIDLGTTPPGIEAHPIPAESVSLNILGAEAAAAQIKVRDFGAIPDDGRDDTLAIRNAIAAGIALPEAIVIFESGRYDLLISDEAEPATLDLGQSGLIIQNAENLTLAGNGTEFILHDIAAGLLLERCRNILVEGIAFDWATPPFTQGRVISVGDGFIDLDLDEGFTLDKPVEVNKLMRYDPESRLLDSKQPLVIVCPRIQVVNDYHREPWKTQAIDSDTLRLMLDDNAARVASNQIKPGDWLLLRVGSYRFNGITVVDSEQIKIKDTRIYTAGGMGFWANGSGDILLDNLRIEPREHSNRLMSVTADAVHFKDCHGKIIVTDSHMKRQGDDCLNIKSRYHQLDSINGRSAEMRLFRSNSLPPRSGEHFRVLDFEGIEIGQIVATKVAPIEGQDLGWRLTLQSPWVSGDSSNDGHPPALLTSLDRSPSAVVIRGCDMGESRGRGILMQAQNALIEHNTITSTSDYGIWLLHDPVRFGEGIPSKHAIIRNNTITDCPRLWRQSAIAIKPLVPQLTPGRFPFGDIQILNNHILDLPADRSHAISALGVDGLLLEGNSIQVQPQSSRWFGRSSTNVSIRIDQCQNIVIRKNQLAATTPHPMLIDGSSSGTTLVEANGQLTAAVLENSD